MRRIAIFVLIVAALLLGWRAIILDHQLEFTSFKASLDAINLSFSIGDWPQSAGIFNSDNRRVTIVIHSPMLVRSETGDIHNCSGNTTFHNVSLLRVFTPSHLHMVLDAQKDRSLLYSLTPAADWVGPLLSIAVERNSNTSGFDCTPKIGILPPGEWQVQSPDPQGLFEFALDFSKDPTLPRTDRASDPAPEWNIPLADAKVLVKSDPSSLDQKNQLLLVRANHTVTSLDGLSLRDLKNVSIQQLRFDLRKGSLHADLAGFAKTIDVRIGSATFSEGESRLTRYRPKSLTTALSAIAGVVGAIAALLSFFYSLSNKRADRKAPLRRHSKSPSHQPKPRTPAKTP